MPSGSARRAAALPPVVSGKGGGVGAGAGRGVSPHPLPPEAPSGTDVPKGFSWSVRISSPPEPEGFTNLVTVSRPAFISSSSVILSSFN